MTMRRGACVGVCVPLRVWARVRVSSCGFVFILAARACVHAWAACQVSSFDQSSPPLDMTTGNRGARCNARGTLQRTARLGAMRNGRSLVAAAHVETRTMHPHLSMYTSMSIYNVWLHIYGTTGLVRSPSMIRRTRKHAHACTPAEARTQARSRAVPAFLLWARDVGGAGARKHKMSTPARRRRGSTDGPRGDG